MVMVLMKFTPITVKARSRSEFSCLGRTAEVAIAAAAPQTPVAQPVRKPKLRLRPNSRAAHAPKTMVQPTAASAITIGSAPPSNSWPIVSRAPSRATPMRSTVRPENSMPTFSAALLDSGCIAMPMASVMISGGMNSASKCVKPRLSMK